MCGSRRLCLVALTMCTSGEFNFIVRGLSNRSENQKGSGPTTAVYARERVGGEKMRLGSMGEDRARKGGVCQTTESGHERTHWLLRAIRAARDRDRVELIRPRHVFRSWVRYKAAEPPIECGCAKNSFFLSGVPFDQLRKKISKQIGTHLERSLSVYRSACVRPRFDPRR
jgi:hypothetical protein